MVMTHVSEAVTGAIFFCIEKQVTDGHSPALEEAYKRFSEFRQSVDDIRSEMLEYV